MQIYVVALVSHSDNLSLGISRSRVFLLCSEELAGTKLYEEFRSRVISHSKIYHSEIDYLKVEYMTLQIPFFAWADCITACYPNIMQKHLAFFNVPEINNTLRAYHRMSGTDS